MSGKLAWPILPARLPVLPLILRGNLFTLSTVEVWIVISINSLKLINKAKLSNKLGKEGNWQASLTYLPILSWINKVIYMSSIQEILECRSLAARVSTWIPGVRQEPTSGNLECRGVLQSIKIIIFISATPSSATFKYLTRLASYYYRSASSLTGQARG